MINEKPSASVSFGNYVDILRRRLWTAVNTFVVATTVGVVATFLAASTYQTRARILVNPLSGTRENSVQSGMLNVDPPDSLDTQVQLLQNPSFLADAFQRVGISPKDTLTHVMVSQVGTTNLIDIVVEGSDPKTLAKLANTMAEMHLQREQDAMTARLSKTEEYLNSETKRALTTVGIAERKLAEYKRLHPEVAALDIPGDTTQRDLAQAQGQLRANDFAIAQLRRRIEDARRRLASMPDIVVRTVTEPNKALDDATASLNKLMEKRSQLLKIYPPANPKVRALDSQIADLQDSINGQPKEIKRTFTEANTEKNTLQNNLNQMEMQLADAQQTRISLLQQVKTLSAGTATPKPSMSGVLDSTYLSLQRDLDTATKQYMLFHDKLQDVQILQRAKPPVGRIVEQAQVPLIPVRPQRGFLVAASILAAIVLSLSLVFLLEYFDDSLKWPEELEWYTGLSILGYSPTIEDKSKLLITREGAYSITAERYRVLRANIQFATVDAPMQSLLVTSAIGGEGKSLVAANLATAFALEGRRVILIDADMRKPTCHTTLNRPQSPGLSELLDGDASLKECVQETDTPNLFFIAAGKPRGNPAEVIGSRLTDMLLAELKPYCDLIVMDAPPCLAVADAPLLAAKTDATLLVVDFSRAKRHIIRQATTVLARARAKVIGAVLNRVDNQRRSSYYGYGYYYYQYPAIPAPQEEQKEPNGSGHRNGSAPRLTDATEALGSLPDRPFGSDRPNRS
ncbi:MAG: polysaccharide biosynthesis tyrosine autokinase [Chthonomonadales bacterium]